MGLPGCCCGCRAGPSRGTSSPLGRGWEVAGGAGGDQKLGLQDAVCSLLQCRLPATGWDGMGWDGVGWDRVPQLQHPFSCRQLMGPAAGGQGWPDPSLGNGWIERVTTGATCTTPAATSPCPSCASRMPPAMEPDPLYRGAACPDPSTPNAGGEGVGTLFPDAWVTQRPPARWPGTWSRRASGVSPPCQVWWRRSNGIALVTCRSPPSLCPSQDTQEETAASPPLPCGAGATWQMNVWGALAAVSLGGGCMGGDGSGGGEGTHGRRGQRRYRGHNGAAGPAAVPLCHSGTLWQNALLQLAGALQGDTGPGGDPRPRGSQPHGDTHPPRSQRWDAEG